MNDKRPPKEVSQSKELAETKRENHKLKRQLAKLQKRLVKVLESGGTSYPDDEDVPLLPLEQSSNTCPDCNGTLTVVQVGPKTLHACKACKWRKVV